jgi:[protein-PII] uridylyltransferase
VKSRLAPIGEGLQVTVYVKDQPDLFARICSYFDRKNFSILDAKIHTTKDGYALDTFLITDENFAGSYRDIISLIEHELCEVLTHQEAAVPAAARPPVAHVAHLPDHPDGRPAPDERGQFWLLSIAANDRNGLLYAIANVLARYRINLHTAKIMTLGERVEDVFLIDGAGAEQPAKVQVQLETELLDALKI